MIDRTDNAYIATAVTATFDADPAERFTYGLLAFLDGIRREFDQHAQADRVAGRVLAMRVIVVQQDWGAALGYDARAPGSVGLRLR